MFFLTLSWFHPDSILILPYFFNRTDINVLIYCTNKYTSRNIQSYASIKITFQSNILFSLKLQSFGKWIFLKSKSVHNVKFKMQFQMLIGPILSGLNSQYFWKWTNANPRKIFGQLASHPKLLIGSKLSLG